MKNRYFIFLKECWKEISVITLSNAFILPAIFLFKSNIERMNQIEKKGEKFETKRPTGKYYKNDKGEFVEIIRTFAPYYHFATLTVLYGGMITWVSVALLILFFL